MPDLTDTWLTPEYFQNPHRFYDELRAQAPIYFSARLNTWIVLNHADAVDVLRDHEKFSNAGRVAAEIKQLPPSEREALRPLAEEFTVGLIHSDPPDHTRMRRLVSKVFTPRMIENLREKIAVLVDEFIDGLASKSSCEFIEDFAFPLPVFVISDLFGVPREDRDRLKAWSEHISALGSRSAPLPVLARAAQAAMEEMKIYFEEIVAQRRREPREDLITLLAQAEESGERLSREELVGMAILILVAGHETTTGLLSNGVQLLLAHPEQKEIFAADPAGRASTLVEEALRMEPSFLRTPRRVRKDIDYGGVHMKTDDMISVFNAAANRDPSVFPSPHVFDVRRTPNRHVSFGYGAHNCLGAPLARLEAGVAFPRLITRLPNLRAADEQPRWRADFSNRRLECLNLHVR